MSSNPNMTRNMIKGVYHKELFKDEARDELVVSREGAKKKEDSRKINSFGAILDAAMKKK